MTVAIEDVLSGVVAYYVATLSAALATIESRRHVTIPRWKYMDSLEQSRHEFPFVQVLAPRTSTQYVHAEVQGRLDDAWDTHFVIVQVAHSAADQEEAQRTILRYDEAIVDVTRADNTYGSRFNRVRLGDVDRSPMIQAQKSDRLLQIMTKTLLVRVFQS